ncbi:ribulokinase [Roseitranquillus sediminis]|uniref:ribulokinase n=1 Tax=Roseitranquillus sediminis TaxID=2809051 RepID=UPI001D0C1D5C|nr:ribulokinase [Roseitranquillus sediminis]MBM9595793.1 ribulokinase [Roseitranquillus sediminis]
MTLVAGADFGTLSVRVTIMETETGKAVGTAVAEYPLKRSEHDPLRAQQSHDDHMAALASAIRAATEKAGVDGRDIAALAADTTGSSVVMVDEDLRPLDDYYLWCDHRAHEEAAEITRRGREEGLEALKWCGGVYSHEWGYAKLLHFLRHNPDKRDRVATALEHCDMLVATLTGASVRDLPRSVCAAGHKWLWGAAWGGLPDQGFLSRVDPLLDGINDRLGGSYGISSKVAGHLTPQWAARLGLRPGIPIPFGAFDAHWDAVACGCGPGDVVNVVGTSTCMIALGPLSMGAVPGICGAVPGSALPGHMGVEAGQSATGDIFDAIARRAGSDVATLSAGLERRGPASTGLLRLVWDNGDRTVLVRPDLGGVTLGWDLAHTAADEMHAAFEGMAMHIRLIIERLGSGGLDLRRVVNGGGIPQKNEALNQIYADVLGTEVHVPERSPVGVGACIFASVAAGCFSSVEEAQEALAPPTRTYTPRGETRERYERLYRLFSDLYFGFGEGRQVDLGDVLSSLRQFRLSAA